MTYIVFLLYSSVQTKEEIMRKKKPDPLAGIKKPGRIPVPQKPPKVMPHGKDYKRNPKHRRPINEERD